MFSPQKREDQNRKEEQGIHEARPATDDFRYPTLLFADHDVDYMDPMGMSNYSRWESSAESSDPLNFGRRMPDLLMLEERFWSQAESVMVRR